MFFISRPPQKNTALQVEGSFGGGGLKESQATTPSSGPSTSFNHTEAKYFFLSRWASAQPSWCSKRSLRPSHQCRSLGFPIATVGPPERLDGVQYSFSADIWGLGISLIQVLPSLLVHATAETGFSH